MTTRLHRSKESNPSPLPRRRNKRLFGVSSFTMEAPDNEQPKGGGGGEGGGGGSDDIKDDDVGIDRLTNNSNGASPFGHDADEARQHPPSSRPPPSFSSSYADLMTSNIINDDADVVPSTPTTAPFFFADAVLDLSEAHDIADTPEAPSHRAVLNASSVLGRIQQPTMTQDDNTAASLTTASADSSQLGASLLRTAIPPTPFENHGPKASAVSSLNHSEDQGPTQNQQQQYPPSQPVLLMMPPVPKNGVEGTTPERPPIPTSSASEPAGNATTTTTTTAMHRLESSHHHSQQYRRPNSPPRWPRDVPWAMAFVLLVPTVLIGSIATQSAHLSHPTTSTSATGNPHTVKVMEEVATAASFHAISWFTLAGSAIASLAIGHVLYGRMSHSADRRHDAARLLTTYSPVLHVATCLGLAICALMGTSGLLARFVGVALPLYYCARDLFLFQHFVAANSASSASSYLHRSRRMSSEYDPTATASSSSSSSSSTSRQAFLQAMVETALDILTRSLNRGNKAPLGRAVTALVLLQFGVLIVWRAALLSCLRTDRVGLLLVVMVAGKWATGTCSRFLTYLASGGVASWFDDQHQLLQQLPGRSNGGGSGQDSNGPSARPRLDSDDDNHPDRMPEAYRMVDASVYQSVLSLDDIGDDADDDDDDLSIDALYESGGRHQRNGGGLRVPTTNATSSARVTVKSLVSTGASVSFGSVAQCGLLGGIAQYVYGQVRKYDAARDFVLARRNEYHYHRLFRRTSPSTDLQGGIGSRRTAAHLESPNNGFRSMTVESSGGGGGDRRRAAGRGALRCGQHLGLAILHVARTFVRRYSDLAMCHVAAYYKSYRHSARDVAALVEESGVESILEDDITTHVCSCAGGAIAGGFLVLASVVIGGTSKYDDWAVLANLLISFYLSYSLLFAVFEPLRAAIKAFYVSFAQHPESLSQAFPLIYHRLSRLAAESSSLPSSQLPVPREYARVSDMNDSSSVDVQLV